MQMLISPKTTLTDIHLEEHWPNIWSPHHPIQLTREITVSCAGYCLKAMSIRSLPFLCPPGYCGACFLDILTSKNIGEVLPMDQLEKGLEDRGMLPPAGRLEHQHPQLWSWVAGSLPILFLSSVLAAAASCSLLASGSHLADPNLEMVPDCFSALMGFICSKSHFS